MNPDKWRWSVWLERRFLRIRKREFYWLGIRFLIGLIALIQIGVCDMEQNAPKRVVGILCGEINAKDVVQRNLKSAVSLCFPANDRGKVWKNGNGIDLNVPVFFAINVLRLEGIGCELRFLILLVRFFPLERKADGRDFWL